MQWTLVLWLALWNGGRATYLSTNENGMGIRATYLMVHGEEPNYENETYYHGMVKCELKQKTWNNQCMWKEEKGSYNENFENEIYEGHGKGENNSSCEKGETRSLDYRSGSQMNVEGNEVEKDEVMRERRKVMTYGMGLATMNELYTDISYGWNYVVNFVYINFYEYLTAELYIMMMMVSALWIWKKRSIRKKMRRSHLSCYEFKKEVVLHVPVARLGKRRQRLHELCQQRKMKVVLWLAMVYSAQAMEGSPVAAGSQGERVFLERVTSLTEAATAAANAAAQALSSMQSRASTGLESATRILKAPDVFTGEDPMVFQTWKFQFSSWPKVSRSVGKG